jgi:hypothetical protein
MEAALRTRLKANATILGMVGPRVDWGLRPQAKDLPAIRLILVSLPRAYTMAGAQTTQHYRVQVDCYGATFKTAKELGDAVIACLEPATGSFQAGFVLSQRDAPEQIETETVYCRSLDFQITYLSA